MKKTHYAKKNNKKVAVIVNNNTEDKTMKKLYVNSTKFNNCTLANDMMIEEAREKCAFFLACSNLNGNNVASLVSDLFNTDDPHGAGKAFDVAVYKVGDDYINSEGDYVDDSVISRIVFTFKVFMASQFSVIEKPEYVFDIPCIFAEMTPITNNMLVIESARQDCIKFIAGHDKLTGEDKKKMIREMFFSDRGIGEAFFKCADSNIVDIVANNIHDGYFDVDMASFTLYAAFTAVINEMIAHYYEGGSKNSFVVEIEGKKYMIQADHSCHKCKVTVHMKDYIVDNPNYVSEEC